MSLEPYIGSLAAYAGRKVIDRVTGAIAKDRPPPEEPLDERVNAAMLAHYATLDNWSGSVQFYRMSKPRKVDEESIELTFRTTPRRFWSGEVDDASISEQSILESDVSFLVLGAPGGGKTTTVKRLIRALMHTEPTSAGTYPHCPILIQLREVKESSSTRCPVYFALAALLGLNAQTSVTRVPRSVPKPPPRYIKNAAGELVRVPDEPREPEWDEVISDVCEGAPLMKILSEVLDGLGATLFLDGLDECSASHRDAVLRDISTLLANQRHYRLIVTCRSSDYQGGLDNIHVIELRELSAEERALMCERWLKEGADEFLSGLATNARLEEFSVRPLFLAQLINLYQLGGGLPQQPYEIYELLTMLLIREWDRERGILRLSSYADFGPEKKLRFLATLAFELFYVDKLKIFTRDDLRAVYRRIREKFQLPPDEEQAVAQEIESHTGIIAATGYRRYEFSHLTLQEYLTADYLVRSSISERRITKYLREYHGPLVIATALSAEPAIWLQKLVANAEIIDAGETHIVVSLLARLSMENPSLMHSDALGMAILGLAFDFTMSAVEQKKHSESVQAHLNRLLALQPAIQSFTHVLQVRYGMTMLNDSDSYVTAIRRTSRDIVEDPPYDPDVPYEGRIDYNWLKSIFGKDGIRKDGVSVFIVQTTPPNEDR